MQAPANRSLCNIGLCSILLALVIGGCSGGISGTGDGPIIIDPDADVSTDGNGVTESTADSVATQQYFPVLLLNGPSSSLTATMRRLSSQSRSTITATLDARIQSYADTASQIALELSGIESALVAELDLCTGSGVCSAIPASVSVQSDPGGGDRTFNAVQYSQGLSGYFDNHLVYTRENGDQVELRWTNNNDYLSLFTDTTTHTSYALIENQRPAITFRQLSKFENALTQVTLASTADNTTLIEADLSDWHVKTRTDSDGGRILYAIDATDTTVRREALLPSSDIVLTETCELPNCEWQPQHSDTSEVFADSESDVGDFSASYINSPPGIDLAQPADRFVIATAANGASPLLQSIVCGATTVLNFQRIFCFTPTPLETIDNFIYQEVITDGEIIYRQVQTQ
jgi:hypothetical protein